jgi:hypothetical protein
MRRAVAAGRTFLLGITAHRLDHGVRHVVGVDLATQETWSHGNRLVHGRTHARDLRLGTRGPGR